jgi:hypothetical protein
MNGDNDVMCEFSDTAQYTFDGHWIVRVSSLNVERLEKE